MDRQRRIEQLTLLLLAAALAACNPRPPSGFEPGVTAGLDAHAIVAPATSAIGFALAGGDRAWLVWTEVRGTRDGVLRATEREGDAWSAPVSLTSSAVIARLGAVPAAIVLKDGTLLTLYAAATDDGMNADLRQVEIGHSPALVERDLGTHHEGRITLVERNSGGIDAIWLREVVNPLDRQRDTSIVFSSRERDGSFGGRRPLDARVCERGTLGAASTSQGLVFAWRSLNTWNEMDIVGAVISEGQLQRVGGLIRDGWRAGKCPPDGAVAAGHGRRAFIGWFTGANKARVKVATSFDGGRTFGGTLRADNGSPAGAVQIAMLGDSDAVIAWHEGGAMLARRIDENDHLGGTLRVANAPGFAMTPTMARDGDGLLLGWRDEQGVKLARIVRMP